MQRRDMQQDCVLLEGADAPWKVVSAIESNGFLQVADMVFGRFASRRVYCKKRVLNVDVCELFRPFEVDTATPIRVLSDCTIFSHYPLLLALCGSSNEKGDNNKRDVRLLRTAAPRCAARRAEAFRATTRHAQENNLDVRVHKTTARGNKTKSKKDDDCNADKKCLGENNAAEDVDVDDDVGDDVDNDDDEDENDDDDDENKDDDDDEDENDDDDDDDDDDLLDLDDDDLLDLDDDREDDEVDVVVVGDDVRNGVGGENEDENVDEDDDVDDVDDDVDVDVDEDVDEDDDVDDDDVDDVADDDVDDVDDVDDEDDEDEDDDDDDADDDASADAIVLLDDDDVDALPAL